MAVSLLNAVVQDLGAYQLVQVVLELFCCVPAVAVLEEGLLLDESSFVLNESNCVQIQLVVLDLVLLEPVGHEDLVYFEADNFDEDYLKNLRHLRVSEAKNISAKTHLSLKAENDCLAKDKWKHLLDSLVEKLQVELLTPAQILFELRAPVVDEINASLASELKVFLHQRVKRDPFVLPHLLRELVFAVEMVDVAESWFLEFEREDSPPQVHESPPH